jgi:hypothetical protein
MELAVSSPKPSMNPSSIAMLVLNLSSIDSATPREPRRRPRGGIVWQPHYEGFTSVAYRDGRAIAGISGPWSDQYVLIWWEHEQPISQVEVFDSLDEAKLAVAQSGANAVTNRLDELLSVLRREPVVRPAVSWLARLRSWLTRPAKRAAAPVHKARRRHAEETDLRGLNFRAVR